MLPDLDGWEICRMVRRDEREQIRGIPILILSARALTEDRVHGLGLIPGKRSCRPPCGQDQCAK